MMVCWSRMRFTWSSAPTRQLSLGTHVGLWHGALTVGGLLDYRGGFKLANSTADEQASFAQNDRGSNDRSAPLWLQARDIASQLTFQEGLNNFAPPAGFYENATFLRFRELSLTYAIPRAVVRALRVQSVSLTGAVRNLALWTRYSGPDPEVSSSGGFNFHLDATSNTFVVNNDTREDTRTVPLLRYWVVRLNVGF
jgi:hypothetical protein